MITTSRHDDPHEVRSPVTTCDHRSPARAERRKTDQAARMGCFSIPTHDPGRIIEVDGARPFVEVKGSCKGAMAMGHMPSGSATIP